MVRQLANTNASLAQQCGASVIGSAHGGRHADHNAGNNEGNDSWTVDSADGALVFFQEVPDFGRVRTPLGLSLAPHTSPRSSQPRVA